MICLVYGPSSSGKSAWAEGRACEIAGQGPRAYLATMRPGGSEARARIEKHLAQRAGKDFVTFEMPTLIALKDAALPTGATVLLDDIGNLVANEMFGQAEEGACEQTHPEELADRICAALLEVARHTDNLVVVADAVGEAGWRGDELTRDWVECCGSACCKLAAAADEVVEVRCGTAAWVKGASVDAGTANRCTTDLGKRASTNVTNPAGTGKSAGMADRHASGVGRKACINAASGGDNAGVANEAATDGAASTAGGSLPSMPVADAGTTDAGLVGASYIYGGNT